MILLQFAQKRSKPGLLVR